MNRRQTHLALFREMLALQDTEGSISDSCVETEANENRRQLSVLVKSGVVSGKKWNPGSSMAQLPTLPTRPQESKPENRHANK